MANPKQQSHALSYKFSDIVTLKASCERFIPFSDATKGTFRNEGKLEVAEVPGSNNEVEFTFERVVTARPKDAGEERIAFVASCKASCIVQFDRPQGRDLPEGLVEELVSPIFYVVAERCRHLVNSMGYPNLAIGPMPLLNPSGVPKVEKDLTKPKPTRTKLKTKTAAPDGPQKTS